MKYPSILPIYYLIGFLLIISGCKEDTEIIDPIPPPVQGFSEPFDSIFANEDLIECDEKTKLSPFNGKWEITQGYVENFLILNPTVARDTIHLSPKNNWFKISCDNTFMFFKDTINFTPRGTNDSITQTQIEYGLWQPESDSSIKLSDRVRSFFRIDVDEYWRHDREIAFPIESSDPAWIKLLDVNNAMVKQRGFDIHYICSTCDPWDDYYPVYTYTLIRVPE